MTENKFELQSYFILYLLFVRILNLSKDIVSFLHISNFFVRERTCNLKNMVVYDVLTFLQTMAFVCSTCVDLDFGVESSLLVRYGLFGVVLISFFAVF